MTPRQQRFVEEYARSRNAAEAAREAGYSPFNAAVRGAQLLRTKGVAEGLRALGIEVPQGGTRAASFCKNAAGLTERQQRFVEQYMILGNASEAARRAGYSTVTAKSAGSQLVRSPRIVAALEAGIVALFPSLAIVLKNGPTSPILAPLVASEFVVAAGMACFIVSVWSVLLKTKAS